MREIHRTISFYLGHFKSSFQGHLIFTQQCPLKIHSDEKCFESPHPLRLSSTQDMLLHCLMVKNTTAMSVYSNHIFCQRTYEYYTALSTFHITGMIQHCSHVQRYYEAFLITSSHPQSNKRPCLSLGYGVGATFIIIIVALTHIYATVHIRQIISCKVPFNSYLSYCHLFLHKPPALPLPYCQTFACSQWFQGWHL